MRYRPLGRIGLEVSLIGLGTMTFGEQNSITEAHEQLDYAVDHGVNFVDTAEMYPVPPQLETQGETERQIGAWLKKRGDRDRLVIASKVAGPGRDWLPHIRGGDNRLDRANIHAAIDDSLRRLRTDYIDLYQVHWPERRTNYFGKLGFQPPDEEQAVPILETLQALKELVTAGKVRHIGISNETPWGVAEYLRLAQQHGLPRIASIQNPYSLLNRSYEIGLAEYAHREQVGLLAYSPLGFGVLSGKYLHGARPDGARLTLYERFDRYSSPQAQTATAAYVSLAQEHGLDPAQMALAYVNQRPFVTSNIIGATRMAQLKVNIASASLHLPQQVLEEIEHIHQRQPNPAP